MFKDGIVVEVDPKGKVKVKFPDLDDFISNWLPIVYPCTLEDKDYYLPAKDSLVTCIMDENFEEGRVLGSIYSEADPPPVEDANKFLKQFADGTTIEYDKTLHNLTADVKGSTEIIATDSIELNSPEVSINSLNISIVGTVELTGSLTSTGNVIAAGISLTGHTHPGDSGGTTGAPQ